MQAKRFRVTALVLGALLLGATAGPCGAGVVTVNFSTRTRATFEYTVTLSQGTYNPNVTFFTIYDIRGLTTASSSRADFKPSFGLGFGGPGSGNQTRIGTGVAAFPNALLNPDFTNG